MVMTTKYLAIHPKTSTTSYLDCKSSALLHFDTLPHSSGQVEQKERSTKLLLASIFVILGLSILFIPATVYATLPNPPTGLTAGATSSTSISLSWTAPAATPTISGYRVDRESPVGGGFSILVANTGSTATTFTDSGLTKSTTFNYRVFTINGSGTGTTPSNQAAATTFPRGNGCRSDCTPPTLGMGSNGRVVYGGFSYNGNTVDVESFFTPMDLIRVQVGKENVAVLKIYDDKGPQNIQHAALAFGLGKGQSIDNSKAIIYLDRTFDGTNVVTKYDPENALDNVRVTTEIQNGLLIVTIYHTFRAPLDFNMVATNVWDFSRNGWQNYYNHGIEITGESMNPPKQIQVLDEKGYPHTITLTGKDTAIDTDGNTWTFDKFWIREYIPIHDEDSATLHGIDRNNSMYQVYKNGQALLAQEMMKQILGGKLVQNEGFGINDEKPTVHKYVKRANDPELQKALIDEKIRASKLLEQLYTKEIRHK